MGRPKGSKNKRPMIKLPDEHHLKNALVRQANQIKDKIQLHLDGKRRMSSEDIALAKLIWGKVVPDLRSSENTHIQKRPIAIVSGVERGEPKLEVQPASPSLPQVDTSKLTH